MNLKILILIALIGGAFAVAVVRPVQEEKPLPPAPARKLIVVNAKNVNDIDPKVLKNRK